MISFEFFYFLSWICLVSVLWFLTDTFIYYLAFLGLMKNTRIEYSAFVDQNPDLFFPDFLAHKASQTSNRFKKLFFKLIGCLFCLPLWFCIAVGIYCKEPVWIAPLYLGTISVLLKIRNWT